LTISLRWICRAETLPGEHAVHLYHTRGVHPKDDRTTSVDHHAAGFDAPDALAVTLDASPISSSA
jgi:hypothetical protein